MDNQADEEPTGPSVDSEDPEERIMARRLRIQKRQEAQKKYFFTFDLGVELLGGDLTKRHSQTTKYSLIGLVDSWTHGSSISLTRTFLDFAPVQPCYSWKLNRVSRNIALATLYSIKR